MLSGIEIFNFFVSDHLKFFVMVTGKVLSKTWLKLDENFLQ